MKLLFSVLVTVAMFSAAAKADLKPAKEAPGATAADENNPTSGPNPTGTKPVAAPGITPIIKKTPAPVVLPVINPAPEPAPQEKAKAHSTEDDSKDKSMDITANPMAETPTTRAVREVADESTKKDLDHQVIRRVIVFPFSTNNDFRQESDLAWWKVREFLSDQQRFLVATKRFMEQNEVYQPRKTLRIADVSILSKAVDSDCLITTYISDNKMFMQAYSAQDGQLLWKNSLDFIPSKPLSSQIEGVSQKLIKDFMANIPYQGFQIVDPINQNALTEEGETILAKVDVGAKSTATQGEKVQWISVERGSTAPLFQGGSQIRVIAEGEVLKNENQVLTVEVKRAKNLKNLDKKSLILIPEENKKIYSLYAIRSQEEIQPNLNLLSEPLEDARQKNESSKPLLVAMVSIVNIVAAVLLAF